MAVNKYPGKKHWSSQ